MLLAARAVPDQQAENKVDFNYDANSMLSVWNHQGTTFPRDILHMY
jgi:hypothetical protein